MARALAAQSPVIASFQFSLIIFHFITVSTSPGDWLHQEIGALTVLSGLLCIPTHTVGSATSD